MDAPASASSSPTEPTPSPCIEVNQSNTQPIIPPSIIPPPQTQIETQQATINGGKVPFEIWDHLTKIEGGDPNNPKSSCNNCQRRYNCHSKKKKKEP